MASDEPQEIAGEKSAVRKGFAQLSADLAKAERGVKRGKFYAGLAVSAVVFIFCAGLTWSTVARKQDLQRLEASFTEQIQKEHEAHASDRLEISSNKETIRGIQPRIEHIERAVDWQTEAMFRFFQGERLNVTPPPRRATIRP